MFLSTKINEQCSGCEACINICPKSAITYSKDFEGFYYPKIDYSKCIRCNKCVSICPMEDLSKNSYHIPEHYFSMYSNDDELLKKSTSGGIFSVIAERFISNGGVVYGHVYDDNLRCVCKRVDSISQVGLLSGVKYVQSDMGLNYKSIAHDVNSGTNVLFSGTPCQVAGIKNYIGNNHRNLFCIDLLCAGVASPGIFSEYIKYIEKKNKDKLINFIFRDKSHGWNNPYRTLVFQSNKTNSCKLIDDYFYRLNMGLNIITRPSCYKCPFIGKNRIGDITLGDYWGCEKEDNTMFNQNKGVSLVLVNTDRGKELINGLPENSITKSSTTFKIAEKNNLPLSKNIYKSTERDKFFYEYLKKGFTYCVRKYAKNSLFNKFRRRIRLFLIGLEDNE